MPHPKEKNSKAPKQKKTDRLPNNKTFFKFLMPKNAYLADIRIGEIDLAFLLIILLLLVFGILMMYSASYAWAIQKGYAADYFFKKQLSHSGIGLAFMLYFSSKKFDYHIIKNPVVTFGAFGACILLLILVHVPGIGVSDGGADRWIYLFGLSFQPSEIMKLGLIILFAHIISTNHKRMDTFLYGIVPYCVILAVVAILMLLQPHLSGTIIICIIALAMMFIGGANMKYFVPLCILGMAGLTLIAFLMYKYGNYDYIVNRMESWLHTFDEGNRDIAWQTRNSLIAIGSGGVFGMGLGNSRQKFLYLPESQNDFVFSIVCEELGFVGAVVVIILFLTLTLKGFSIASNAPDKYGMLLASGITIQISVQALLNIAVVTNTIPNTGISLPFFSYGGSALIMQLVEMGIILNISRQSIPSKKKPDSDNAVDEMNTIQEAKKQLGAKAQRHRS